jgi:hypothetical protein
MFWLILFLGGRGPSAYRIRYQNHQKGHLLCGLWTKFFKIYRRERITRLETNKCVRSKIARLKLGSQYLWMARTKEGGDSAP